MPAVKLCSNKITQFSTDAAVSFIPDDAVRYGAARCVVFAATCRNTPQYAAV